MEERRRLVPAKVWGTVLAALLTGAAGVARAQAADAPPPAAPAVPPAAPDAAPPPPAVVVPPPATPPSAVATEVKPPTATEAMPATRPDVLPPIDVGAWVRASGLFQGSDPSKVNDWHMNNAYAELHTGGKVTKEVGVTLNLNANMANYGTSGGGGGVALEDAIISFDFMPEFHVWAGHLLVQVDRSNSSGPFFMIPWNFPGFLTVGGTTAVGAPAEGPFGRNNGINVWGDLADGKLSYFAGVYDNGNIATSPLFSGKLRLALLDPEKGFWGNGSYFGDKDIFTIDLGGQVQDHGSTTVAGGDKTYADVNVDALFEKKLPGGSWFTADAAYYHFNVNDGGVSNSLYALVAYATPTVGVGHIQPMVRYQWADVKAGTGTNPWNLDVAVAYLIKGPALRLVGTYSYDYLATNVTANSIQIGAQAIFF
jgi:hypothetical protein